MMTMNVGTYNGMYSNGDAYSVGYNVDDSHSGVQYHAYEDHTEHYTPSPRSVSSPRQYNASYYPLESYDYESVVDPRLINCPKYQNPEDYYNQIPPQDGVNIITSNGLSYTNLDYGNSYKTEHDYERLQYQPKHHCNELQPHNHEEYHDYGHQSMAIPGDSLDTGQYHAEGHYTGIKEETLTHHLHYEHGLHRPQASSLQSTTAAVPTYKWMQVKRNVPKPAGRAFAFSDISG